ncbi:hypothetical protein Ciccas_003784, partial [Cichlidogyrus casuarinus]
MQISPCRRSEREYGQQHSTSKRGYQGKNSYCELSASNLIMPSAGHASLFTNRGAGYFEEEARAPGNVHHTAAHVHHPNTMQMAQANYPGMMPVMQTQPPLMMCEHHRQHHAAQLAMANQPPYGMVAGPASAPAMIQVAPTQPVPIAAPHYHPHHHYHHLPANMVPQATQQQFQHPHMGNGIQQQQQQLPNAYMKPPGQQMPQMRFPQPVPQQNARQLTSEPASNNVPGKVELASSVKSKASFEESDIHQPSAILDVGIRLDLAALLTSVYFMQALDPNPPAPQVIEADDDGPYGEIQLILSFDEYDQSLTVHIARAKNLRPMDLNGLADPFVKVRLHPDPTEDPDFNRQTKYIDNSLEPEWQQTMVFMNCLKKSLKKRVIEITVWDFDRLKTNDFMGQTLIHLNSDKFMDGQPHWFELHAMRDIIVPGLHPKNNTSNVNSAEYKK